MMTLFDNIAAFFSGTHTVPATELFCPVCGYYCLGNGGVGCIDKPGIVRLEAVRPAPDAPKETT